MTALDLHHVEVPETVTGDAYARLHVLKGDAVDEGSIQSSVSQASKRFGPIHILIVNAGIADQNNSLPIWELPLETWEKTSRVNVRGTFLTIKHFLRAAQTAQQTLGRELDNLAIVVTGESSSKSDLQTELVHIVKTDIVRLNSRARINVVATVNTSTVEGNQSGTQASYDFLLVL